MLFLPTSLALLPFVILTALPLSDAQATGYAFCSGNNLEGACQYVASTMTGFDACNAIKSAEGSLQVWEGTKCTLSRSESCDCNTDDDDECEIIEGPRTLENLGAYKIGGEGPEGEARGFSCDIAAGREQ